MTTGERPRLILHVGQHKTGSKALQSFLEHNRRPLAARGLLYPMPEKQTDHGIRAYTFSHFRLYALLRHEATALLWDEAAAAFYWSHLGRFCLPFTRPRALLEAMDAERRAAGARTLIVSAEDLFDMHSAHELGTSLPLVEASSRILARLAAGLGYEPRVVVYLRRQDHLLAAQYVQFLKGGPVHDIAFDDFARQFGPRLDARAFLEHWAAAFGPDRVIVRPYERASMPAGIVSDFFRSVLGRPVPDDCRPPPADAETVNRSLDRDHVEFLRILNRRTRAGLAVFDREAVLEAALRDEPTPDSPAGIAAWLSPADRRALLEIHEAGNAAIARDYLGRTDGVLFAEPPPGEAPDWVPYPGLSPDRAAAIALAIHETIVARGPSGPLPSDRIPIAPPGEGWLLRRLFRPRPSRGDQRRSSASAAPARS